MTQTPTEPTWIAVISDSDGFVMTDEDIRAWCADQDAAEYANDSTPEELAIVTGTAKPDDGARSGAPRLPGSWTSEDRLLEEDLSSDEPDTILRKWERAVAVAAALNAAGVQA